MLIGPLQRDPEVWGPRADVFDPENFAPEAEAKRPAWAFKPFGNGQRACIGRGFALHEAALALGVILQRFDLIDVHRYQLKLKETLTVKPEGFTIKVKRRAEADRPRAAPVGAGRGASRETRRAAGRAAHAQHAAAGALRLQSRHGGGIRASPRGDRGGQRLCDDAWARSTITSGRRRSRAAW